MAEVFWYKFSGHFFRLYSGFYLLHPTEGAEGNLIVKRLAAMPEAIAAMPPCLHGPVIDQEDFEKRFEVSTYSHIGSRRSQEDRMVVSNFSQVIPDSMSWVGKSIVKKPLTSWKSTNNTWYILKGLLWYNFWPYFSATHLITKLTAPNWFFGVFDGTVGDFTSDTVKGLVVPYLLESPDFKNYAAKKGNIEVLMTARKKIWHLRKPRRKCYYWKGFCWIFSGWIVFCNL